MTQQLTINDEKRLKEIANYLFKNQYPRTDLISVMKKFGLDEQNNISTCKALSILKSGNMIDVIIKHDNIHASFIQILDQDGNEIPSECCDTFKNSMTFGVWFKEYSWSKSHHECFDHLQDSVDQEKPMIDNCEKCFIAWSNIQCLAHNQSIVFCQKCHNHSKKLRALICDDFNFDQCIDLLMSEHKKDLLRRRGF